MNSRGLLKEIQTKMINKLDIKPVEWLVFLDKKYWGNEAFSGITENFKKFLIGQIDKIAKESAKIREEVLWQSLLPQSFLGKIFSFKRLGRAACTAKGSLKWVATQLDRLESPYQMEKETLLALVSTNSLLIDLTKHHFNLFNKLQAHYLTNSAARSLADFTNVQFDFSGFSQTEVADKKEDGSQNVSTAFSSLGQFENHATRSLADYANIKFDFSDFSQPEVTDKKEDVAQNASTVFSEWPLDKCEDALQENSVLSAHSKLITSSSWFNYPFKKEKSNFDNKLTFFRKNSNTVVCSTIATPEGRKENPNIYNEDQSKKSLFTIR